MNLYLRRAAPGLIALSSCVLAFPAFAENPGCVLFDDPRGDATTLDVANMDPNLDIISAGVASVDENIYFYLEMASLDAPPANTSWPLRFNDSDGLEWGVLMETDPTGAVSFSYYDNPKVDAAGATTVSYGYIPNRKAAGSDSHFTADGLITIVVPASAFGAESGDVFEDFISRITSPRHPGGGGLTPDNAPDDLEPRGIFTVGGSCLRSMQGQLQTASHSGAAPFQAHFDAGLSQGDGIAGYRFEFGDGSRVESLSPQVSHIYQMPGRYAVTVRPRTADGNYGKAARTVVTVTGARQGAGGIGHGLLVLLLASVAWSRRPKAVRA